MSPARRAAILTLTLACLLTATLTAASTGAVPGCAPVARATTPLPGRVDTLLALDRSGAALALVGPRSGAARYLPHDNLVLLNRSGAPAWRVTLPPYVTPPGLAVAAGDPATIYVVVDHTVLLVARRSGTVRARVGLDMQALGWPAAAWAGPGDHLYVVGQPDNGWTAVAEALAVTGAGAARVVWRARLGLFHAGIWLGPVNRGSLATYLPGAYDRPGAVTVLDARTGAAQGSYAVPSPPIAIDPRIGRLYVEDGRAIHALPLAQGVAAATPGQAPLAVSPARGIVAFAEGGGIVVANAGTLRPLGHLTLPGVTALALTPDGSTLLAARRDGVAHIALDGCRAA